MKKFTFNFFKSFNRKTAALAATIACCATVNAQTPANDVYWREGFDGSQISSTNPGNTGTAQAYYAEGASSGTWYLWGTYRTTGTACPDPYGPAHIRFRANSVPSGAPQQLVTPIVNNGVSELHFASSRSSRTFTIFWTADTAANTSNWQQVAEVSPSTLCVDNVVPVNQATARRIKIEGQPTTDSDIDSIWLTSVTALPVRFAGFSAFDANGRINVEWKIATEINTATYEVERSLDGRSFSKVGAVAATEAGRYSYIDNNPENGINFYRIKAVDKDGGVMYSNIIRVNRLNRQTQISIAPNPVKGGLLNLQLSNVAKGSYTITVYNGIGQQVISKAVEVNGTVASFQIQLPATAKAGIYNLQLRNGSDLINKKVVVE